VTNIDLLTRTNDHIRKHEHLWNQATYAEGVALPSTTLGAHRLGVPWEATEADLRAGEVCGTAMCFAGWGALLDGWHQLRHAENYVVDERGRELHMADAARESLGITEGQSTMLFDGLNDLELIDRFVAALVANPGITRAQMVMIKADYVYGPL
jgi:hypothetical protein